MNQFLKDSVECPIYQRAKSNPQDLALLLDKEKVSYSELNSKISEVAGILSNRGVGDKSIVALRLDSSVSYVTLLFAIFRLKGIAVPLNNRYPIDTLPALFSQLHCDLFIGNLHTAEEKLIRDDVNYLSVKGIESLTNKESLSECVHIALNQPATVVLSSGSSGQPKAILHAWGNHYYSALGSNQNIQIQPGDMWCLSLPLYHVAGIAILFRSFLAGASVLIPAKHVSLEEAIQKYCITHISLVSTQLRRLIESLKDEIRFESLKAVLVGGSSVSANLLRDAFTCELPIFLSYGMTEMASQVTTTPPSASRDTLESSGKVLRYREISFDNKNEILVRGATRFIGYLQNGELSTPFDEDGWFRTGDLGYLDQDGLLHVSGRKDNMFISGGENIYPEQIETVLIQHPDVKRVLVVPVDDPEFGKRPVAFIDVVGSNQTINDIEYYLQGKLPRYMYPIKYISWAMAPVRTGIKDSRFAFEKAAALLI